jgi:3-deoxy-D-manno-octulosonic-acid transferase
MFVDTGACRITEDANALAKAVDELLADTKTARRMGDLGRQILERNRGALARLLGMVEPLLQD